MDQDSLNELEAAMLKKRLKFLRAQGATGKPTYRLGDDFFKQMEDHWVIARTAKACKVASRSFQPSRAVLILLPLTLIDALDYASNVLKMHRTDVIRRSLIRDVNSALREEVSRAQRHQPRQGWSGP